MMNAALIKKVKFRWIGLFLLLSACVDPAEFNVSGKPTLIIEGMISDLPGPYSVKVSSTVDLATDSVFRSPMRDLKIKLYDDLGNTEDFKETDPGTYVTDGLIQGRKGHSYHIELETPDGNIFKSDPDSIRPVGEIENIRFEFESRTSEKSFGTVQADVFNIYVDSYAGPGIENYVRWRYTGTYRVISYPELHFIWQDGWQIPDPYPCSGYTADPSVPRGSAPIVKIGECTCCICWAIDYEEKPHVSGGDFIVNNKYKNVKVGEVPISPPTFYDKFMVVIDQMSLSSTAYDFFKLISSQKEGTKSLFQPPSGKLIGNIKAVNSNLPVVGLFYATSIFTKRIFIQKSDLPYPVIPIAEIRYPCTWYPNGTTIKPALWE